jgi:hypothetical protein
MNELLDAPFTTLWVEQTLFMMHPHKAPGLDGFTIGFYQHHWGLIGQDICTTMLALLNGGNMPQIVNNTM